MPTINRIRPTFKPPKKPISFFDNDYGKYYNIWREQRNNYYMQHPLDELDLLEGKTTAAAHVHHCIPFGQFNDEDTRYFYLTCEDNFISLSKDNHYKIHFHPELLTDKEKELLSERIKKTQDKFIRWNLGLDIC